MARRAALFAMLLGVLSFLPLPSFAGTGEGIVLRGSRTAYVDLYVYKATTIDLADLRMSTKGSYVGFFMSPAPANRDTVGALVMPRVGATGADSASIMKLGQSYDVRAGKYRVFLITDGAATVFIPIDGQGYRGYTPSKRASFVVKRADFNIAAGSAGATHKMPVSLRSRSLVGIAGVESSSSLTAVETMGSCVSVQSADCALDPAAVTPRLPAARQWTSSAALVKPGLYSGVLSSHRVVGGFDAPSHFDAALFILTIGIQS